MEMSNIHPKLIKANVALYNGERSETRRLLKEYVEEQGKSNIDADIRSLILWLDAQSQHRRADRIERLQKLFESTAQDSIYHQMARQYLQQEETYRGEEETLDEDQPIVGPTVFGVPRSRALSFALAGGFVVFLLMIAFNVGLGALSEPGTAPAVATQAPDTAQATAPPDLPDTSVLVQRGTRLAQFPQGQLEVVAVENQSQRIIETNRGTLSEPIQGARYYALRVIFACRIAICSQPPQANLALLLANGEIIGVLGNAAVAGQNTLQPVAQGNETDGWIVFQIPTNSDVVSLQVLPQAQSQGETPVALSIDLSALE